MLLQSVQLHPSQNRSAEKHSQYSFKHLDFLQLHAVRFFSTAVEFSFPPPASRGAALVLGFESELRATIVCLLAEEGCGKGSD